MRRLVPRNEVLPFTRKKLHQWNRQTSGTCSTGPLGLSVLQLLWYHLTPYFLFRQLLKLWRLK